jgi:ketosteroid isomerase-like protein
MFTDPRARTRRIAVAAILPLAVATACGGDDSTQESTAPAATEAPTTAAATTEAPSTDPPVTEAPATVPPNTEPTTDTTTVDDDAVEAVARSLCEAYGNLDQPDGVEALLALMTDDVVVTDTVLGASLTGHDQIRAYVTGDAFAQIDSSECGATVRRGNWVAGSYTLSNSATGAGGQGIAAIHVTDGKVDQQINHYTPVDGDAAPPPDEPVTESIVLEYCHAWDDGGDVDAVLALMSPDPELIVGFSIAGVDAIRDFVATFPFDQNDCGDVAVVHGAWGAAANTFVDSTTGELVEGVNVVEIVDGRIDRHFVYLDHTVSWTGP